MRHGKTIPARSIVFFVGAFIAIALSSCSSDDSTNVEVVTPEITSFSDTVLSLGDRLVIAGSNFATPATSNRVVFNNTLASVVPFSASSDTLEVVVPQNANSGPAYVSSKGVKSNSVVVEIERGVGDVWVLGGGAVLQFKVPAVMGDEEYLIVPESATSSGASFPFTVTPDTSSVYPAPRVVAPSETRGTVDFASAFETRVREEALEYLRTHGAGKRAVASRVVAGAPLEERQFYVLKCTSCSVFDRSSFATVTATLQYTGTRALVYSDVEQPEGSYSPAEYQVFGEYFDNQVYRTDSTYFGPPQDIDGNGKVIILFTPVVNDLTPDGQANRGFIAGFVLINDFAPSVFPSGTSNGGEIFYSIVPDPTADYGNSFTKAKLDSVVRGTLAHEFEHMISIGYRYLVLGGGTNAGYIQQLWLEEGMAHMAEDFNDMDTQNILRANRYLATPYGHSLLGNAELRPYDIDTLEQRGAVFLFLRYLGDRYGDEIFKTIVRSPAVGTASIENVTGTDFYSSVCDYLAALYLSDRGITTDPRYEYSSFDIQREFADLLVTDRVAQNGVFNGAVRSAAGNFYRVTAGEAPALEIRVSSASDAKLRVIVVRTQ